MKALTALSLIFILATPALALDRVERKSTQAATQGSIVGVSRTELTLQTRTQAEVKIPANDVVRVRWDGEPAALNLLRNDEKSGRLDKALAGYQAALADADASNVNMRSDLEFSIARTIAKMAQADPTKLKDAIAKLDAFLVSNSNHFRYFEALDYLGQMYSANADPAKANETYRKLADAVTDFKMAGSIAEARVQLEQKNVDQALALFDSVIATQGDEPAVVARRYEAMLGKAACLQKQSKPDEAAKVLEEVIDRVGPDETRVQAEAFVRLGDNLQSQGKTKEALLAYLYVEELFPNEKALHAESLYHLSRLWAGVGYPNRAAEASARLKNEYPNSDWAKQTPGAAVE